MIMPILAPLVGVLGAFSLAHGAWLIYPPAGSVVVGALCLLWSWLVARYLDRTRSPVGGGKQRSFRDYFNEKVTHR